MGGGGGRGGTTGTCQGFAVVSKNCLQPRINDDRSRQKEKKKSSLLTEQGIKKNVALCVNLVTGVAEFVRGGEKQSIGSPGRKIKNPSQK